MSSTSAVAHLAKGIGRLTNLTFTHGTGTTIHTSCGHTLLDFTTGIGVLNTGHSNPRIVSAAQAQLSKIVHAQVNVGLHEKMIELTEVLLPTLPDGLDRLFYGTTGAEAVENAVKVARCFTGKHAVVSILKSFSSLLVHLNAHSVIYTCLLLTGCISRGLSWKNFWHNGHDGEAMTFDILPTMANESLNHSLTESFCNDIQTSSRIYR